MVVMDYVEGFILAEVLRQRKMPVDFLDHPHQAIRKLHDTGLVFGNQPSWYPEPRGNCPADRL